MFMIENTKVPKTIKKKQLKYKFKNESTMCKFLNLRLIKQSLNQQGLQMVNRSHKSLKCVFDFYLFAQFNQNKWFLITFMLKVLQKVKSQFLLLYFFVFFCFFNEDKSQIIYIYIDIYIYTYIHIYFSDKIQKTKLILAIHKCIQKCVVVSFLSR